jgi:hypothetical protein
VVKTCVVCGAEFKPHGPQKTCGIVCSKLRQKSHKQKPEYRQRAKEYAKEYIRKVENKERANTRRRERCKELAGAVPNRVCVICGDEFKPRTYAKTCGPVCMQAKNQRNAQKYRHSEKGKERLRRWGKLYRQTVKYKEWKRSHRRKYSQTPQYKLWARVYQRLYHQKPEIKEKGLKYRQTSEFKILRKRWLRRQIEREFLSIIATLNEKAQACPT